MAIPAVATQAKSLAMDMAAMAAGGAESLDSFGWCSEAEDYRFVSYDLVQELCDFASGLDSEIPVAIALNAKMADVIIDLTRLSRLVVDLANLRRQGLTPIFEAADNPILAWLCAGGPGDGAVVHGYSAADWRLANSHPMLRQTARRLRRWFQVNATAPSRRIDMMSNNRLLSEFGERTGKIISDILPPPAGWRMAEVVPSSAADMAEVIANKYKDLLRSKVDLAPDLLDSAVRGAHAALRYHLAGALTDLAHLRRNGPRRIGHLLISGTPKYVGRMLSRYYQDQGSRVFRFAHGGERVFFEDYHWGVTELPYCDRYYTHSQAEACAIERRLQDKRLALLPTFGRDISSLGSNRHQRLLASSRTESTERSNTVMYIPNLYMGEWILNVPAFRIPDPQYYEWQVWLLKTVRALGYRLTIKLHPRGLTKWNRLLEPYADEIIGEHFDAGVGDPCCYLFDFAGTAFFDALASNIGVVFLHHAGRPIDPHAADDLTNRCQVVPCQEDDALRMRTSADALAAAMAKAAEFPGVSDYFSQKYFY